MTQRHIHRLNELERLQDGWLDGDGIAPTDDALHGAYTLLITARIFPTPEGGVQIEWTNRGREQSVRFSPDGSLKAPVDVLIPARGSLVEPTD